MTRSTVRMLWSGVAAAALVGGGAVVRADIASSTVYVAVAKDDKPVPGLTASSFQVVAGGQEQPVLSAEPASEPLSIVIFMQTRPDDTSLTRSAVRTLLGQMRAANPEARVGLATGPEAPTFVQVTSQAVLLERTLGTFYTDSTSGSLVDRLPEFTRVLSQEPNRRRVILSITPPGVTHGTRLSPDTAPSLQRCGCELWGIVVDDPLKPPLERDLDRDDVLSNLITASGGRRANVVGAELLEGAARIMATLMLSQYKVTFQHPDSKQPLNLRVGVRSHLTGVQVYAPAWTSDY